MYIYIYKSLPDRITWLKHSVFHVDCCLLYFDIMGLF